jgi:hypothetical protein
MGIDGWKSKVKIKNGDIDRAETEEDGIAFHVEGEQTSSVERMFSMRVRVLSLGPAGRCEC